MCGVEMKIQQKSCFPCYRSIFYKRKSRICSEVIVTEQIKTEAKYEVHLRTSFDRAHDVVEMDNDWHLPEEWATAFQEPVPIVNNKGEKKKKVQDFFSLNSKGCIVGLPTLGSMPILTKALSQHRLSLKSHHSNNSKRSSLAERLSIMVAEENYDEQHMMDQNFMQNMEDQLEQIFDDDNGILTNTGNNENNENKGSCPVSERSTSKSTNDSLSQKSQKGISQKSQKSVSQKSQKSVTKISNMYITKKSRSDDDMKPNSTRR